MDGYWSERQMDCTTADEGWMEAGMADGQVMDGMALESRASKNQ